MTRSLSPDVTRQAVDSYIADLLRERADDAAELGESYEQFWHTISSVVMAGGKRIRPHLTVIAYGELDDKIVPVAAAQELIHIAMLMHDDVIDQDFVRHGVANVNGRYQKVYAAFVDEPRRTHYAYSAAVLAGDALLSESYHAVHSSGFDAEMIRRVSAQLHRAVYEVIGGELLDVEAAFVTDKVFSPLSIYRYKTSSYSFICPLVSGAICARKSDETIAILTDFATNIGIAFQIQDDLLGVFGDEAEFGKTTTGDLREGKRTLLVAAHEERMNDEQREHFSRFGVDDATDDQLSQIKKDLEDSGAKAETEHQVRMYFDKARAALDQLRADEMRQQLEALHLKLSGRRA